MPRLRANSYDCVVTSPPYWGLRDYGDRRQIGLERSPWVYLDEMVKVFREIRRVMKPSGTLWLNMGDSYAGDGGGQSYHDSRLKIKDMMGLPWRLAFALQDDGWYLRRDHVWHKPNVMPESAPDRATTAHEYVFLLTKQERYYFNHDAGKEPVSPNTHERKARPVGHLVYDGFKLGRGGVNPKAVAGWDRGPGSHSTINHNKVRGLASGRMGRAPGWRSRQNESFSKAISGAGLTHRKVRSCDPVVRPEVWSFPTSPYAGAHFATFPAELPRRCLLLGCPPGGRVLDPFAGSGTTLAVAKELGLEADGVECVKRNLALIKKRLA
ncbi:MAG: site-specific DNA-methyltransferase [Elusimicrobiota bacterium]